MLEHIFLILYIFDLQYIIYIIPNNKNTCKITFIFLILHKLSTLFTL